MTEKKLFPSQINTKSIACRIPFEEWTKINSECIEKGININDWLLNKIYGKVNGTLINDDNKLLNRDDVYDFIVEDHCGGNCDRPVPNYVKPFWEYIVSISNDEDGSIEKEKLIRQLYFLYKSSQAAQYHQADPDDMLIQADILLKHTKWDHRDQMKFRKEFKALISELKEELEGPEGMNPDDAWYPKMC